MAKSSVTYEVKVDDKASPKLKKIGGNASKADKELKGINKTGGDLGATFGKLGPVFAGAFAVGAIVNFGKQSLKAFDAQAKADAQLRASLESTGQVAGRTFEQLKKQASDLQRVTLFGDEQTQEAQSLLLTFTNIRNEVYDRTIPVIQDLATATKTDLKSASIQLGKALNAPVENLSALSRAGIQFSKEQKDTIKTLVETNRLADAQKIILKELETQFGGSAKAAARAGLGPWKQLQNAFGDFQEQIGEFITENASGLLDVMWSLVDALPVLLQKVKELFRPVGQIFDQFKRIFKLFGGEGVDSTSALSAVFEVLTANFKIFSSIILVVTEALADMFEFIKGLIPEMPKLGDEMNELSKAGEAFAFMWENLPEVMGATKDFMFTWLKEVALAFGRTFKNIGDVIIESFRVDKFVKGNTQDLTNSIGKLMQSEFKDIGSKSREAFEKSLNRRMFEKNKPKMEALLGKMKGFFGVDSVNAMGQAGATGGKVKDSKLTESTGKVTGQAPTTVNLNIGKLVENLSFNTQNISESTAKIKEEVTRVLTEALLDTSAIANN